MRLVLFGGPDLYYVPSWTISDSHIAWLLRPDRRRNWPYRAGTSVSAR